MRLYWVGVEDLHHLAEVHTLHKFVDFLVVEVMTEHQQNCVDVPRLRQAHNEVPQVDDACVYLLQDETKCEQILQGALSATGQEPSRKL